MLIGLAFAGNTGRYYWSLAFVDWKAAYVKAIDAPRGATLPNGIEEPRYEATPITPG